MQAEKVLLIMINATVSHELRNPLMSMIGQIYAMDDLFKLFSKVIKRMMLTNSNPELFDDLVKIYKGLHSCG
jgi:signal transduction histidine kinase